MKLLQITAGVLLSACATVALAERKVDETVPSNHYNGKVEIDAGQGTLEIVGWDKNEVRITGTIGDGIKQLDIGKGHRKVKVRALAPKEGEGREVHLVLHAPQNNDISVPFFQGGVKISGIEGDIEVETLSGNISVSGTCKRVDARSASGNITFDAGSRDFSANKIRANTVSGAVIVRNVRREAEVQTISGEVTITGNSYEKVTVETVSGNVRFEGRLTRSGRMRVDTHSGQIVGILPAEFAADFNLTSFSGHIENAFAVKPDKKHELSHGDGETQAEVRATTFRGNIRLTKQAKDHAPTAQAEERLLK